jgi:uncharacterized protein (DUF1330 family)
MTAYLVFTRLGTKDPEALATYSAMAPGTTAGHNATPLVAYGNYEVLEGPAHEGMVILAFPTMDEASAFYHSPAYTEARAHRFKGADYHVTLIQGI